MCAGGLCGFCLCYWSLAWRASCNGIGANFGRRNVRFYGVSWYAGLVLVLMLFLPAVIRRGPAPGGVVGWYLLAKLLETFDKPIFALGALRQRTHAEIPGGGHGGVVDFADVFFLRTRRPYLVQLLQARKL